MASQRTWQDSVRRCRMVSARCSASATRQIRSSWATWTRTALVAARDDAHEQTLVDHAARLAEVERALVLAQMVEAPKPADYEWVQAPLPHEIRLNSVDSVSSASLYEMVKPWTEKSNIGEDDWTLTAATKAPCKNLTLRMQGHLFGHVRTLIMQGPPTVAARRASSAMAAFRRANGTCRPRLRLGNRRGSMQESIAACSNLGWKQFSGERSAIFAGCGQTYCRARVSAKGP